MRESIEQRHIDPLTDLPNARQALHTLRAEVSLAKRSGKVVSALCVDVDRFRFLNSRCGHTLGNELLTVLARLLEDELRDFDFLARLGDDRFLAIGTGLDRSRIQPIVSHVESTAKLQFDQISLGLERSVSISAGGACFPEDAGSAETLLLTAYQSLYQEKLAREPITLNANGSAFVAMSSAAV